MTIKRVTIQLKPPSGSFPGRTTEGRYIVNNGVMALVDLEGKLVTDAEGNTYQHTLRPTDHARSIAGALTRQFHGKLKGDKQSWSGPLEYFNAGKI
jgi:hypothetical protein